MPSVTTMRITASAYASRDVQGSRASEEAEDRNRQRRVIGSREEDGRAELAERDREREARRHRERAGGDREGRSRDARAGDPRRGVRLPRAVARRSHRSVGVTMRTTKGIATSAWTTGTIQGADRKSRQPSSKAMTNPKPSITADAPSGSMSRPSNVRFPFPPASAKAASPPIRSAIAVAAVA